MGLLIENCDLLRTRFGCTVILVHHAGKYGDLMRGSSALMAAADTVIAVKRNGTSIRVTCIKQKDGTEFDSFALRLTPSDRSCIMMEGELAAEKVTKTTLKVLKALSDVGSAAGASLAEWQAGGDVPERSFYRAKQRLLKLRYVAETEGGKFLTTPEGLRALPLPFDCQHSASGSEQPAAATATPHMRGQAGSSLSSEECRLFKHEIDGCGTWGGREPAAAERDDS